MKRVVIFRVGQAPVEGVITDLASMQAIVGGLIECVRVGDLDIWCNDEGRYTCEFNRNVMVKAPDRLKSDFVIELRASPDPPFAEPGEWGVHSIYGDFFFARSNDEGETTGLTDHDVLRLLRAERVRVAVPMLIGPSKELVDLCQQISEKKPC